MDVRIRSAKVEDLDTIYEIERECFPLEAFSKRLIAYLLKDPNSISLVALVDDEVAGFIICSILKGAGGDKVGHVLTIDVALKHRRKGIASRLMIELERRLKAMGVKACSLEVREDNVAARELYRKHGYVEIGPLMDYYGKGAHGIRLQKALNAP